jgi:UDP-glucose 4-epimerase
VSSGGAVYGEQERFPTTETDQTWPVSPYGVSKRSGELYAHFFQVEHRLPFVAMRYANVYGPRQDQKGEGGVIGVFCKMLLSGKRPSIFGGGAQTRDFVYVDDVVEANLKALFSKKSGVWHVATGKETSVNAVGKLIADAFGWTKGFGKGPAPKGDVARSCLDASKAKKDLGWKPEIDVELGIRRTVAWFKTRR